MTSAVNIDQWLEQLMSTGYCIIPDLLPRSTIRNLEADLERDFQQSPFGHGDFYGYRTKRFGSLLRRTRFAADLVREPTIMSLAQTILKPACERIQLNVAQAIEIHPGEIEQFPHCDQDMWPGDKAGQQYLLNVMWPLSRFTKVNGATIIYPGIHKQSVESLEELPEPIVAECQPGSAICFLGSTIHGAGANRSDGVRRAALIGYSLGWLKPYENLWLAYPPHIAKNFEPDLAKLVGYTQHRPNLGNYEGQCPSTLLHDSVPAFPRAADALRPDQQAAVREFADSKRLTP